MKYLFCAFVFSLNCTLLSAQYKRAMTFDEMIGWKRISSQQIAPNGKWVVCKMESWRGDAAVYLYNEKGEEKCCFPSASKGEFSSSSNFLIVTENPTTTHIDSLNLKKTAKDKMPMNKLKIVRLNGSPETIDSLIDYKLAKAADLIAYRRGKEKQASLYIRALGETKTDSFPNVSDFGFAKKGDALYFVSDSVLYTYTPQKGEQTVGSGKGVFKQIAFNESGDLLAYLFCPLKDSAATHSSLYIAEKDGIGKRIVAKGNEAFPPAWVISEHARISFSKDNRSIFFGTAPAPKEKDTMQLAEKRPEVQIWTWNEKRLYTEQNYTQSSDLKRSFAAVYSRVSGKTMQLATEQLPVLQTADEGNAPIALLSSHLPYEIPRMWTGRNRYDIYTLHLETGKRTLIAQNVSYNMQFSPKGKYTYWYCAEDSSWYTRSVADGKEIRLTRPEQFAAWDEENDVPDLPSAHGIAGWTTDDRYLLIKDRYDIWRFDPTGNSTPVNLTVNGRKERIRYTLLQLEEDKRAFRPDEIQYLSGFNETTKGYGYYASRIDRPTVPQALIAGNFRVAALAKAKKSDAVIFTQETYEQYPDLRLSDLRFRKSIQLTHGIRQQDSIRWGTAELTSWISLDGQPMQGIIYKPADFDPQKKYPVIVNFYERNSNTLHHYHMASPGRSTIDYPFYLSHGFIIFNPDVRYTDGYPGESCYNCVMPGIASLIAKGYVDEKAIGAQGHSWGGYQVAYLATRTHLFAAIESGAPVVNMISAYGGIRWGSGKNRAMQYEHGQSRIGGNLWEKPLQYIQNSPIFDMHKVTTPILIMHNDADGHVPWYQGIEYFVALRRLQKPCWLLNYPGEPHWPSKMANRIDFQKRMFQFFSHYLQKAPMPRWMAEGIPAVERDFELGY